jgi:hypothetical protein
MAILGVAILSLTSQDLAISRLARRLGHFWWRSGRRVLRSDGKKRSNHGSSILVSIPTECILNVSGEI